jgi:hypothetical protein
MATVKELEKRVEQLQALFVQITGRTAIPTDYDPKEHPPDYVEHGSDRHAALLGLVEVDGEVSDEFIVYTSPDSGRMFRLEDQITAFMHYPDPMQVARLVLRQKVSELEAGVPPVPKNAPDLWVPAFVP